MQKFHILIGDSGDGSNHLNFYKGSEFTRDDIEQAAENDKYDSYMSGDGVQVYTVEVPDNVNLNHFQGIHWEEFLPGVDMEE